MNTAIWIFTVIATFCFMEFIAWFSHKYIMHGFMWFLHKDCSGIDFLKEANIELTQLDTTIDGK